MLENREGKQIPEVTFRTRSGHDWKDITTKDLFAGKKVVLFSLPGAFTPTCSSTHLPRYNQLAATFKKQGVDDIVCVSVNDAFVMDAWKKDQEAENVILIPDGNGEFTKGMGLLVDKAELGFGPRSWRYSMLVNDGVIEKMFIEPEKPGDPFEISDADTMLHHINPKVAPPKSISMISREGCRYCAKARKALDERGWPYEEILLGRDASTVSLTSISGRSTTPQVFIEGKHIGGSDDLEVYLKDK